MTSTRQRPDLLHWIWYAWGGGLPARYNDWVLHDTTCSTWIVRHVFRTLVLIAIPVGLVVIFLPASIGLKVLTAATAGGCAMMFAIVHIIETTERRLIRAGYPGGSAEATRNQRSIDAQRIASAARRQRIADRRDRRTGSR